MKEKIALFDIDKTIIKRDSMFLFLWYTLLRKPSTIIILFPIITYTILFKSNVVTAEKVKEYYFYGMKLFDQADLRAFYDKHLKKSMYQDAIKEMQQKKKQGYRVILVSASPFAYVQYFRELPYVDYVIGTELISSNGRFVNKLKGKNCKGIEKVNRINEYLHKSGTSIDYENSFAYSDSLSDLPMFQLVNNRCIVNRSGTSDMEVLTWKL